MHLHYCSNYIGAKKGKKVTLIKEVVISKCPLYLGNESPQQFYHCLPNEQ